MKKIPARIARIENLGLGGAAVNVDGQQLSPRTAAIIVAACKHMPDDKHDFFADAPLMEVSEYCWAEFNRLSTLRAKKEGASLKKSA